MKLQTLVDIYTNYQLINFTDLYFTKQFQYLVKIWKKFAAYFSGPSCILRTVVSVAQLVARRTHDRKVVGSILTNTVCFTVVR